MSWSSRTTVATLDGIEAEIVSMADHLLNAVAADRDARNIRVLAGLARPVERSAVEIVAEAFDDIARTQDLPTARRRPKPEGRRLAWRINARTTRPRDVLAVLITELEDDRFELVVRLDRQT